MKNVKYIFFAIILFIFISVIFNTDTTRKIGINYEVYQYDIPIFLKIFDFYNRHFNYKYLVKDINVNLNNKEDVIINTTKWVHRNIKKIPLGVDIVDHHPLTIFERRLGLHSQFNDLLSVLLVYSNIDSFFIKKKYTQDSYSATFFKINDYWSFIDPYYGIYFINHNGDFASIEDIYSENWVLVNLNKQKIEFLNISKIFDNKFQNYDDVKNFYINLLAGIKTSNQIDNINLFDRGGRSYLQQPINRLRYEISRIFD